MLAEGALDGIHIFFPDPWHKTRHKKRRLIQPPFVALLASRLKPGGYIHCATDWENYALQMLDVLGREPSLQNSVANPSPEALAAALEADSAAGLAGFAPRPDYRPLTKFENRGLRLGHGCLGISYSGNADMWFKNLQIYRLPTPWAVDLAKLDEQLARGEFTRCPSNQPMSRGWVSPRKDGALIYANNRQWLIALAVEQRLLPSSVVNETAQERAEQITDQQGYPPGRKQMKEIKERRHRGADAARLHPQALRPSSGSTRPMAGSSSTPAARPRPRKSSNTCATASTNSR